MTRSMETQIKMCPPPTSDVLEKTRQQVIDLFDEFLSISTKACENYGMSKQTEIFEVLMDPFPTRSPSTATSNPPRLERDTGERAASKPVRPISRGSLPEIDLEFYRKNTNNERPVINPVPPRPAGGPSVPQRSTLPSGGVGGIPRPRRVRTYSTGPSDQQLQQAAYVIAEFGDELEKKYGSQMDAMGEQITAFLRSAGGNIAFAEFSRHMNQLMEAGDTNATNLMVCLMVGKRVVSAAGYIYSNVKEYFGRYAGERFAESVAQQRDVVTFIKEEERRTKL